MTFAAPLACALLCSGCFASRVIPDPSIPHRISRDVNAWEWRRLPDGTMTENPVRIPAGWWIAAPQVVEGKP